MTKFFNYNALGLILGLIPLSSTYASEPIFSFPNIAACEKMDERLWNCVPDFAEIMLEDDTLIREASPDLVECKAGKCMTSEGEFAGNSVQDGSYYVLYNWQLIQDGKFAAYPIDLSSNEFENRPDYVYPSIPAEGEELRDFIPWGWKVIESVSGDLNRDGKTDWAFVLQADDPRFKLPVDNSDIGVLDSNPRTLLVLMARKNGGFQKWVENNDFIPVHDNPSMLEPLQTLAITDNQLQLGFAIELTSGSWTNSSHEYTFDFSTNGLILSKSHHTSIHRGSGETSDTILDYINKSKIEETGTISSDETTRTTSRLDIAEPQNLNSMFYSALDVE